MKIYYSNYLRIYSSFSPIVLHLLMKNRLELFIIIFNFVRCCFTKLNVMQERLLQLLAAENISQSEFAQKIGVSGSNVTHIISGRNNPSYEFLLRVASHYPTVNIEWLLLGKGKMYRESPAPSALISAAEGPLDAPLYGEDENIAATQRSNIPFDTHQSSVNQRKAVRVTVYYDDGTFQDL